MSNQSSDGPDESHTIPPDVDDATIDALGKLSEALETATRARGALYDMHQLIGGADLEAGEAVELLREAGHDALADRLATELVGRNVIADRWTFQIVEDFDDNYYATFVELEALARGELAGGRRHLFEARMKEQRRTHGEPGHEARP